MTTSNDTQLSPVVNPTAGQRVMVRERDGRAFASTVRQVVDDSAWIDFGGFGDTDGWYSLADLLPARKIGPGLWVVDETPAPARLDTPELLAEMAADMAAYAPTAEDERWATVHAEAYTERDPFIAAQLAKRSTARTPFVDALDMIRAGGAR